MQVVVTVGLPELSAGSVQDAGRMQRGLGVIAKGGGRRVKVGKCRSGEEREGRVRARVW